MDKKCTVYKTVDFISKRWTMLILLELYKGNEKPMRYSDIKKTIPGITPKMLSARLKEIESLDLITKSIDAKTFPVKCEYRLTESGQDFIAIIKDIKVWALKWKIKNKVCRSQDCSDCIL